ESTNAAMEAPGPEPTMTASKVRPVARLSSDTRCREAGDGCGRELEPEDAAAAAFLRGRLRSGGDAAARERVASLQTSVASREGSADPERALPGSGPETGSSWQPD